MLLCFTSIFATISCESYLAIDPPNDRLETGSVFSDSTSASLAIIGIYSDMMYSNLGFVASQGRLTGLCADELDYSGSSDPIIQFRDNNIQVDNSELNSLWGNLYKHIYQSNSAIEGIAASSGISVSAKETLTGEAKFIRAFLLFHAVNYWGDIPLTINTDYRVNESMPRTETSQVYALIVSDLEFAMGALKADDHAGARTRPHKWTAASLLARVYLYQQQWEKAAELATEIIESGKFLPLPTLDEVFKKESRETIWQLFPATSLTANTPGYYYIPSSLTNATIPTYPLPQNLYGSFGSTDERKNRWIGVKDAGPYLFSHKYKERSAPVAERTEYTVIFRVSEQFLIRAEARLHLSDLLGAVSDLNTIRARATANPLSSNLSYEEVFLAIENERRLELFNDWGGHRWFDLKRTGRADSILGPLKGNSWQSTDKFWPIPLNQLLTNQNLTQNPGY